MAPEISFPHHVARNKRPAISSPPNPARYNRNQSEIALAWWAKKKERVASLKGKVARLQECITFLEEESQEGRD
jgi:hypothetical protein